MHLIGILQEWRKFKEFLEFDGVISQVELHIIVGTILFLIFFLIFREKRHPAAYSLLAIFVIEIINEVVDMGLAIQNAKVIDSGKVIGDLTLSVGDVFWTMAMPLTLYIISFHLQDDP